MPRYLLNEVDVHVKLFQNKNSFCLLSSVPNKKYKVVISEVMLKAAMIGIHADILKSHARAREDTTALYPLTLIRPTGVKCDPSDEFFASCTH